MTVKELVERLNKLPEEMQVGVWDGRGFVDPINKFNITVMEPVYSPNSGEIMFFSGLERGRPTAPICILEYEEPEDDD